MRLRRLRRLVNRSAAEVAGSAPRGDVEGRREFVGRVGGMMERCLAGLDAAVAAGANPLAPAGNGWAEPTLGEFAAFLRAELAALDGFDRGDVGTGVLVYLWLRTYFEFREAIAGPADRRWPCPTPWLELQLHRLAWRAPGRVSDGRESNRLNGLLWSRRDVSNCWDAGPARDEVPAGGVTDP